MGGSSHSLERTSDNNYSNGVVQPYRELGWWQWMYRVSPYTYVIEGLLGQGMPLVLAEMLLLILLCSRRRDGDQLFRRRVREDQSTFWTDML